MARRAVVRLLMALKAWWRVTPHADNHIAFLNPHMSRQHLALRMMVTRWQQQALRRACLVFEIAALSRRNLSSVSMNIRRWLWQLPSNHGWPLPPVLPCVSVSKGQSITTHLAVVTATVAKASQLVIAPRPTGTQPRCAPASRPRLASTCRKPPSGTASRAGSPADSRH